MGEKVIKKILMIFGAAVCWAFLLAGTAFAVDLPDDFEAPNNGIPVVYIIIDESEEGIAAAQAADKDGYTYGMWSGRAEELNEKGWHIRVSDYLEKTATPEQRLAKVDIADMLIGNIHMPSVM